MSIRPVDYTSLIPKSQEVTKVRQVESEKHKNQIQIGFEQQQKQVDKNIKKVRDTNKTEGLIIDTKKEKRDKNSKRNKKDKGKDQKEGKLNKTLGGNIDIRV